MRIRGMCWLRQYCQMDRVVCWYSGMVEMSWMPNCAGNWNAAAGRFTIHALQDIPTNTLLIMSYGNSNLVSVEDQLQLIDGHTSGCKGSDCERPDAEGFWGTMRMCVELLRLLRQKVAREYPNTKWDAFSFGMIERMVGLMVGCGMSNELVEA
jgi:hypothetical protein